MRLRSVLHRSELARGAAGFLGVVLLSVPGVAAAASSPPDGTCPEACLSARNQGIELCIDTHITNSGRRFCCDNVLVDFGFCLASCQIAGEPGHLLNTENHELPTIIATSASYEVDAALDDPNAQISAVDFLLTQFDPAVGQAVTLLLGSDTDPSDGLSVQFSPADIIVPAPNCSSVFISVTIRDPEGNPAGGDIALAAVAFGAPAIPTLNLTGLVVLGALMLLFASILIRRGTNAGGCSEEG